MTTLTKEMRKAAIDKAVTAAFSQRRKNLEEAITAFGEKLYETEYGAEAKQVAKLPARWYRKEKYICLECDGFSYRANFDRQESEYLCDKVKLTEERIFPGGRHLWVVRLKKEHPLYAPAQALVKEHRAVLQAENQLRDNLTQLLYSVRTYAKLKEVWPEGETYYGPEPQKTGGGIVPYGLTLQINRVLGIA